jgi:hypothetical protein
LAGDAADSHVPFVATTVHEYDVFGVRPVWLIDVPACVETSDPFRYTLYPVAPGTAAHDSVAVVVPSASPFGFAGARTITDTADAAVSDP